MLQQEDKDITCVEQVQEKIELDNNLEVSKKLIRQVMKKDLNLSFVKNKKLSPQSNSDRALVLR